MFAARCDELGRDQLVAGESELRSQVADASTECETGDTGRPYDAPRRDKPGGLRCGVEVQPGRTPFCARDARCRVDPDSPQSGEVDDESVVADAVTGRVVSSAAYCHLESVRLGEREGRCDICSASATRNHRRPSVDQRVEAAPRVIEVGVIGRDHLSHERAAKFVGPHGVIVHRVAATRL